MIKRSFSQTIGKYQCHTSRKYSDNKKKWYADWNIYEPRFEVGIMMEDRYIQTQAKRGETRGILCDQNI